MHCFLNIIDGVVAFDHWLFKMINGGSANSFFDILFPIIRQSNFWMPFYLFLFVVVIVNFKKNWWWWIVLFLCTVAITDMAGTNIFKHVVRRLRPCDDPAFLSQVRMVLKECAGGYSFISNHAANTFGLCTFVFFTLSPHFRKWFAIIWLWPLIVCFGQIYVGVHYPSDVFAGALIGLLVGSLTARLFKKRFGFVNFEGQPTVTTEWK